MKTRSMTVYYTEYDAKFKMVVEYGFNKIGTQDPYFSITANVYEEFHGIWREYSSGCQHELIAKHAPELEPLIKWHLTGQHSGPMHYEANAMFWWDRSLLTNPEPLYAGDNCVSGDKALEYFKSTIVYGVVPTFDTFDHSVFKSRIKDNEYREFIRQWIKDRLPEVMEVFHNDMKKFEVE